MNVLTHMYERKKENNKDQSKKNNRYNTYKGNKRTLFACNIT